MAGAPGCSFAESEVSVGFSPVIRSSCQGVWASSPALPNAPSPPALNRDSCQRPPPRAAGSSTQQETEGGCGPRGTVGGRGLLGRRLRDVLQSSSGGAFPVLPNPGLPRLPQPPAGMRCRPGPRPEPFRPWCCRPGPPTPGLWHSSPRAAAPLPPPCGPAVRTTWSPPGGGTVKRVRCTAWSQAPPQHGAHPCAVLERHRKHGNVPPPMRGWRGGVGKAGACVPCAACGAPTRAHPPGSGGRSDHLTFHFINDARVRVCSTPHTQRKVRPRHSGHPVPDPATGALSPHVTPRGTRLAPLPSSRCIYGSPRCCAQLYARAAVGPLHRLCPQGAHTASWGDMRGTRTLPRQERSVVSGQLSAPQEGRPGKLAYAGAPSKPPASTLERGSWVLLCTPKRH